VTFATLPGQAFFMRGSWRGRRSGPPYSWEKARRGADSDLQAFYRTPPQDHSPPPLPGGGVEPLRAEWLAG